MGKKRYYKKKHSPVEDLKMLGLVIFSVFFLWLFWQYPFIFTICLVILIIAMVFIIFKLLVQRFMHIKTFEDIIDLSREEFEEFIAFVLRKKGFTATVRDSTQGDGGIDIDAYLNEEVYFVQCKQRKNVKVSEPDIRDFLGAVASENPSAKRMYVTTSRLSGPATKFAKKNRIEVWDKHNLVKYVALYTQSKNVSLECEEFRREVEPEGKKCEKCGGDAILREAKKGMYAGKKFYGCSEFPECTWMKNIEQ